MMKPIWQRLEFPPALPPGAAERLGDRLIHDPLQLGVAAMAFTGLFES